MPPEQCRNRFKRWRGRKPKPNADTIEVQFPDKLSPDKITFSDVKAAYAKSQVREKSNVSQNVGTVSLPDSKPIALSFISDMHIGSPFVDYEALFSDIETIRDTPGFYVCMGGDGYDNFLPGFKDAGAVAGQLQPPQIQLLTYEKILEELGDKLVGIVGGNHNEKVSKATGVSPEYFVYRGVKCPYLRQGGLLRVNLGGVEYQILWKHNYRFGSSLNQFNSHHRMLEMLYPMADIVVTEHEHNPGIETVERFDLGLARTVVSIRTGSYKGADPYSMNYFKAGRRGPQTVLLWPKERKILPIHGEDAIAHALTYMRGLDAA